MNSLSSLLSFGSDASSPLPPVSAYIAVTDTLASSGSFIPISLARTMLLTASRGSSSAGMMGTASSSSSVEDESPGMVVWVGCDGSGEVHWRTLLRKAGINAQAQTRLKYIDTAEILLHSNETGLKELLEAVRSSLGSNVTQPADTRSVLPARALVVVDDITTLAWSLASDAAKIADRLSRWIRALRIVIEENGAALCTLQHASATSLYADVNAQDTTDDDLLRHLVTSAGPDMWVEIRGLRSGRAKDCDGEIVIRPMLRPQLGLTLSRQGGTGTRHELSAFALPNLPIPPRPFLFRVGADPTARLVASGSSRVGQVEDWKGVQLWARGMMSL
ncbi:unnamed protein product [Tilletia controversa]|uniref:Uncharacterized protein n=3 Tax=Tilletia TaxID=13289 RepID=A0A8X7SSQ8_9BASI|nr:hypothetical protein CF336_g8820 [Tilletia laevis]KAE8182359.1 hypothetical protein CF328_g8541 [Tilletia controversa]KAE8240700.1 hypothetical protein A4X03_0g8437 [Tilletia caries]KAE8182772.1 hypothetical protein CF335_g8527 [Tilletia laevis]KAE8238282.1 hypothetical protein A4X06_0g8897 [Tilletia controversa]